MDFDFEKKGYLQALKDLLDDGILSQEEYQKRVDARIAKSKDSYNAFSISYNTDALKSFGEPTTATTGTSFNFVSNVDPSAFGSTFTLSSTALPPFSFDTSDIKPFNKYEDHKVDNTAEETKNANIEANNNEDKSNDVNELAKKIDSNLIVSRQATPRGADLVKIDLPIDMTIPSYKVCVIGDGGVGKSAYVNRISTGNFEKNYKPTIGGAIVELIFETNRGPIKVNVWDTAGKPGNTGLKDGYYIMTNGFILMFDLTSQESYKNAPMWLKEAYRQFDNNMPLVLVGNKFDAPYAQRTVKSKSVTLHRKKGLQYFEISTKSNYNLEKPFLSLLQAMTKDPGLQLLHGQTDENSTQRETEETTASHKEDDDEV